MRYRVHFVARFEREIEAKDDREARQKANIVARHPWPDGGECHWNTCHLIDDGDRSDDD